MHKMMWMLAAAMLMPAVARADEGMWTPDNVPVKKIKAAYGFEPDAAWLKRVQLATTRFPGGTGSFVSREGLVITNHHVGRGAVAQVSTAANDYVKSGFVAATREAEIRIPNYEIEILVSLENVTDKVRGAVKAGMKEAEAVKARKDAFEALRAAEEKATGLFCEAKTLYQGGEYWVYRYKKFKDVRLVMAPEGQMASWGGDDDNYSYPRFDLDFTLFRVYEDGKPYTPEAHLPFATDPLKIGDLTFVSGHPGTTFRQWTLAQMTFDRDVRLPWQIASAERRKKALRAYAATSPEAARLAAEELKGIDNGRKRNQGRLNGLLSPAAIAKVADAEKALQAVVAKDAALNTRSGQSWTRIAEAVKREHTLLKESSLVNTRNSQLLGKALDLVRVHAELDKAVDQRLTEFQSDKAAQKRITSTTPLHKDLDEAVLTDGLAEALEHLGAQHPFVKAMLGGKSPAEVAKAAVQGTKMDDPAFRKQLLEGGAKAVAESTDPMLVLARRLDPMNRAIRKQLETEVTNVTNEHLARIAEARFKAYGKDVYPDATFSLRLSYGPVATYANGVGTKAQPFTTLYGLMDRHIGWGGNEGPAEGEAWHMPQRWVERRDKLTLSTPYNFIYACDTVGGNSGSPVINTKGHFVGINFDSVYEGQGGYYVYEEATKRSVALDARGILEVLDKIFEAKHLVQELKAQ